MAGIRQRRKRDRAEHPTRRKLIDATLELIDEFGSDNTYLDDVVDTAGVTKGAVYHHFTDFTDLMETALAERFAAYASAEILEIDTRGRACEKPEDLYALLADLAVANRQAARVRDTLERGRILATATQRPTLNARLEPSRERLRAAYLDLLGQARERRWIREDVDPDAVALLIPTLGLVLLLDGVETVTETAWRDTVTATMTRLLAAPGGPQAP